MEKKYVVETPFLYLDEYSFLFQLLRAGVYLLRNWILLILHSLSIAPKLPLLVSAFGIYSQL